MKSNEIPNEIPNEINDKIDPSQRPGRALEFPGEARETTEANPPALTRKVTMEDVYDIIGWHPKR
jgi:hypothetical protein